MNVARTTLFADYAGTKLAKWREVLGLHVTHTTLGDGRITHLDFTAGHYMRAKFERQEVEFAISDLCNSTLFSDMELPAHMEQPERLQVRKSTRERAQAGKKAASEIAIHPEE